MTYSFDVQNNTVVFLLPAASDGNENQIFLQELVITFRVGGAFSPGLL